MHVTLEVVVDEHDLLVAVKEMALELGRSPHRDEFCSKVRCGKERITSIFGTYSQFLMAAGLEPNTSRKRKVLFAERDVSEQLREYFPSRLEHEPHPDHSIPISKKFLILGDTHFPWADPAALERAYEIAKKLQPEVIVQVGDLYDMLAWSKFPISLNGYTPKQEIELAYHQATQMWARLKEIVPQARCVQLHGNHTIRPLKRVLEVAPALEVFIQIDQFFKFEGVEFVKDPREELIIDGVAFIHGYASQIGRHRDFMQMSCVVGHSHRGGVVFRHIRGKTLFELNAGYLADPQSKALGYTNQRMVEWTQGVGIIDELGPRFVPF